MFWDVRAIVSADYYVIFMNAIIFGSKYWFSFQSAEQIQYALSPEKEKYPGENVADLDQFLESESFGNNDTLNQYNPVGDYIFADDNVLMGVEDLYTKNKKACVTESCACIPLLKQVLEAQAEMKKDQAEMKKDQVNKCFDYNMSIYFFCYFLINNNISTIF